ncbi:bifunctional UDP-N-acetylglucosamine diphosphorylase/glucosamine-1-phosphate N-acetyltransferase GlmU [Cellulomonas chengniuliangii]|uniref:Bifunctional protein GlmU n=1 Tax=Cellulomonas chengniuliangii TaxID=2968084 RepID=A0ABY5L637_9CELL|nr:bifunctional UDP-N-acetylglucosamine diphosphorylase/glucosamine-1-phosphate N-acetyltransferase GlmU [Cellulomonas chengniuliangii]MCC2307144.1 bifunctional UDP-N-acetylglucosamine diphosphorylase/glucosamine-1-phosphate N-acetyltransferase GlmU [Cellulomonas chengniuliangii]UUI76058.1 bifunctional UDP-N-acetylglucosamine diphosphorylase/glucosamine-1-phosphate N-acetyltransferase GlmU [Cellulomonas chengniuliangii]
MTTPRPAAVIVLAAGEGTRMRSATPKVLHALAGRSMLGHALTAARELDPGRVAVVVRHERDLVAAHARQIDPQVLLADQDDVPGTGRAVQCALSVLDAAAQADAARSAEGLPETGGVAGGVRVEGPIVVLAGDIPLLDGATLAELLAAHTADDNAVTVLTTEVDEPTGYGRVLRDASTGDVTGIVEEKDADAEQRAIREINSSVYVFDSGVLRGALGRLGRDNAQGEVYLTDVLAIAREDGGRVRALRTDDPLLVEGVNDRVQLASLRAELNRRILDDWMRSGVTVVDPATTWVDVDVDLARDVTLLPGTQLHGATSVGEGATVGPDTTLTDVEVAEGATVVRTHGSLAVIGAGATVGPFAYLRPGTVLGANGKIGTFVETKNAQIGAGSKVPHLSYVGDATIGEETNIGAASVFVNYDGVNKHHTTIGSYARTGSDNMFVAPVTIGDGAYTGAGSVIRRDVPPGALGVSSGAQRNIEGWVLRARAGTPAAAAAERALGGQPDELSPQARAERDRAQNASTGPVPTPPPTLPDQPAELPDAPSNTKDSAR